MNYYNRIQRSLDYIERNLEHDITLSEVASQAYCSLYHYHRLFQSMVGYTVKDYIRRRRLSCAAQDLLNPNYRIIDIAFKYRYKTHESFSRAFLKEVGVLPKEYRKHTKIIYCFDKVNIYNNIYKYTLRDNLIGPEIINKSAFKAVGIEYRTSKKDEIDFKQIPVFWNRFFNNRLGDKIPNKICTDTYLGYSCGFDENADYSYFICSEVDGSGLPPEGMVGKTIPASRYATFKVRDPLPENLINTWRYVYNTWLPDSGLELIDNTDFEEINMGVKEITIYIPIR